MLASSCSPSIPGIRKAPQVGDDLPVLVYMHLLQGAYAVGGRAYCPVNQVGDDRLIDLCSQVHFDRVPFS